MHQNGCIGAHARLFLPSPGATLNDRLHLFCVLDRVSEVDGPVVGDEDVVLNPARSPQWLAKVFEGQ